MRRSNLYHEVASPITARIASSRENTGSRNHINFMGSGRWFFGMRFFRMFQRGLPVISRPLPQRRDDQDDAQSQHQRRSDQARDP